MNSILISALLSMLFATSVSVTGWQAIVLASMESIPPYTLVPRLILSLRKLYARDLRGGRGGNIDTAFGLTSGSGHGAAVSAIMFADGGENEGSDQGEEIQMEEMETGSTGGCA